MSEPKKLHVLYLEDNDDSREMISTMLQLSNVEVSLARTATDAWELIGRQTYDLYLLDGILANGDSLAFCRELRMLDPKTPIVFYSALSSRSDIERATRAGASLYIVKPYFGDLPEAIIRTVEVSNESRFARNEKSLNVH